MAFSLSYITPLPLSTRSARDTVICLVRIRRNGDSGGREAHAAVSRRPPISFSRIVARSKGYTHAAKVWVFSIVQGPFSVAPWFAKPS